MTGIPYCDVTLPVVSGCSRCSPACEHCWAIPITHRLAASPHEATAARYRGLTAVRDGRLDWTGEVRCHPELLDRPRRWRKPRRVFVASQADLFHERVPEEFIADVYAAMNAYTHHTYLVLTKRPERMLAWARSGMGFGPDWPSETVWFGATAWDSQSAQRAIECLRAIPGSPRLWLSLEPQLESTVLPRLALEFGVAGRIDWIVQGCESGPGRRPFDPDWARAIRDQCQAAGVPYYLKQMPRASNGQVVHFPLLDGRQWLEVPGWK